MRRRASISRRAAGAAGRGRPRSRRQGSGNAHVSARRIAALDIGLSAIGMPNRPPLPQPDRKQSTASRRRHGDRIETISPFAGDIITMLIFPERRRARRVARRNREACGNQPAMARPLTSREAEVFAMLANGASIREISDAFDIAERSARAHIQMIVEKLGVDDGAQAAAVALREGIVKQ
jgi:DNA-binding CsgD family transcriptional regulator